MESINNFDKAKEIIKNNLISRVESVKYATSKDKYFEYLKDKDVSDSELEIVKNKEKENDKKYTNRFREFIKIFLITFSISLFILFILPIFDFRYNSLFPLSIFIVALIFNLAMSFISVSTVSNNETEHLKKNASPDELKNLYKKEFKANIDNYLSLNKKEIKELCDSNEFIRAYIKKNPNEIFTRYSLNKVAGIKMNNLHMINEFKDIIDNKKILDGLPDGQKIFINDIIMKEQKLN